LQNRSRLANDYIAGYFNALAAKLDLPDAAIAETPLGVVYGTENSELTFRISALRRTIYEHTFTPDNPRHRFRVPRAR
jgi:hypothetical protein